MTEHPFAATDTQLFDLAVASAHKDIAIYHRQSHQTIAGDRHCGSVYPRVHTEYADFAATRAKEQLVCIDHRESVVTDESSVGQLAVALLQVVLH